ncbi:hypothetical protein BDW68DRAFT_159639 [Aspergillus falconensis]
MNTAAIQDHPIPFTNHVANDTFMVLQNTSSQLPPLFPLWYTSPTPAQFRTLRVLALQCYTGAFAKLREIGFQFRFDVYFIPGESEGDCIAHRFAARDSRPDCMCLLRESKQKSSNSDFSRLPERLPGMVKAYHDSGIRPYRRMLLMSKQAPDWCDDAQKISRFLFDLDFTWRLFGAQ